MRCVILTGMSGSGKSTALKMIEDMGYYCVGNLPISLVESFVELAENDPELEKVAINVDIRSGQNIGDLTAVLDRLQERGKSFEMLFLESEDSVIIKRYKETRRSHPLAEGGSVELRHRFWHGGSWPQPAGAQPPEPLLTGVTPEGYTRVKSTTLLARCSGLHLEKG